MPPKRFLAAVVVLAAVLSSAGAARAQDRHTLWAVDFVKTKDGQFDDYLRFNRLNWKEARREAVVQGYIRSYKVLTLPGGEEWDVVLMTEYANAEQYAAREENFRRVFQLIRGDAGPVLIDGKGPRDMADIRFSKLLEAPLGE